MNLFKSLIALLSIVIILMIYLIKVSLDECSNGNSIVILPPIERGLEKSELTPFEKEFKFQRDLLGPGMTFEWNNNVYTTNLEEITTNGK